MEVHVNKIIIICLCTRAYDSLSCCIECSQLSSLETSESSDSKDELKEITPSSSTSTNELQSVTVKVTNLPKGVTKQELKEMIKYSPNGISAEDIFGVCMMQGGARSTNHAFVVCSTQSVAERVVDFLDSKQMGESDTHISAKVQKTQCDKPQGKLLASMNILYVLTVYVWPIL